MSSRHFPTFTVFLALAPFLALASSPAVADVTKAECVQANRDAQSLRRAGKLGEARSRLQTCSDPKCPALVNTDCTKRLDELESAQPTIVFDAKDGSGHDLIAVAVAMDGQPLADKLDGTALRVDPGSHEFTFTVAGQAPVTQTFVLREGQKERHEAVVIGSPPPPPAPAPEPVSTPARVEGQTPSEEGRGLGTQRVLGFAVGGVGVAGVAVGSIFGLMASSKWSKAQSDCGTGCRANSPAVGERSDALTDATVSTVGFIVGGVGLAAGAVLWFTSPAAGGAAPSTGRVRVIPTFGAKSGALLITGEI